MSLSSSTNRSGGDGDGTTSMRSDTPSRIRQRAALLQNYQQEPQEGRATISYIPPTTSFENGQGGIPEYVGGDSLRSVRTIDGHDPIEQLSAAIAPRRSALSSSPYTGPPSSPGQQQQRQGCSNNAAYSSDSSSCWVWKVRSLPHVLPHQVPLARTAWRLKDVPISTISSRICHFMRHNSICCTQYTNEEGRLDCLTESCLKFMIQLWQEADDNGTEDVEDPKKDNSTTIILEVQRRRGCAIAMQYLRKCLYRCVASSDNPLFFEHRQPYPATSIMPILRRPSPMLERRICEGLKKRSTNSITSSTTKPQQGSFDAQLQCLDWLESQKKDENRYGMESLLVLADPTKVNPKDADEVARALIYNDGKLASRIRASFEVFFIHKSEEVAEWQSTSSGVGCMDHSWSTTSTATATSDDMSSLSLQEFSCASQGNFSGGLEDEHTTHLLALKVLTNCLDLIACREQDYLLNETTLLYLTSPFWRAILLVLVFHLRESCQRPQEAALSTKCIRLLERLSEPEVLTPFLINTVAPLLLQAYEFGKAHHLALERESEELLISLMADEAVAGGGPSSTEAARSIEGAKDCTPSLS